MYTYSKKSTQTISWLLATICTYVIYPTVASAQGLVPQICDGATCSSCHIVGLANNVIGWLIGVVLILFGVLAVMAGFKLVTSGGNPSALQDAKNNFTNAFIGLLIVLSAWILVDTLVRGLVGGTGNIEGWGPWSQVQCFDQSDTRLDEGTLNIETLTIIDSSTDTCALADDGTRTDCTALTNQCEAAGDVATTNTSNPSEHTVTCARQNGFQGDGTGVCSTPASDLVSVNLMGGSVQVHRDHVASVNAINSEWERRGGSVYYQVNQLGSYAPRTIAGSSRCSAHSLGGAIDVNWGGGAGDQNSPNPHCPDWAACGGRNVLITNMDTQSPPFYTVFTSNGWRWGGAWSSSKDAMHFSPSGR